LVRFTLFNLGFRGEHNDLNGWTPIADAVVKNGLALVPQTTALEVAIQGKLSLLPDRGTIIFLSDPIRDQENYPHVLELFQRSELCLFARYADVGLRIDDMVVACIPQR